MGILKNRFFLCVTVVLVGLSFWMRDKSDSFKLFTLALLLLVGLSVALYAVFFRKHTPQIAVVLLGVSVLSAGILTSYLYFNRMVGGWNAHRGEICTVEGYFLSDAEKYGSNGTRAVANITEWNGMREGLRVEVRFGYKADFVQGETFRATGYINGQGEQTFGNEDGSVGFFTVKNSENCTIFEGKAHCLRTVFWSWSRSLNNRLQEGLSEESQGIAQAFLLGNRENIPEDAALAFRRVGISHLLALSGLHIAVLAGFADFVLSLCFVPRMIRSFLTVLFALLFVAVSGGALSTVRAFILLLFGFAGRLTERQKDTLTSLAVGLSLTLIILPCSLTDLALWLSYAAAASMAVFLPGVRILLAPFREMHRIPYGLREVLSKTVLGVSAGLFANAATLPFVMSAFGEIAWLSVPATLLLSPLFTLCLLSSLGICLFPRNSVLTFGGESSIRLLLRISKRISDWDNVTVGVIGKVTGVLTVLLVLALVLTAVLRLKHKGWIFLAPVLAVAVTVSCVCSVPAASDAVSVTYLRQYDSEFLLLTEGRTAVVFDLSDGGGTGIYAVRNAIRKKGCTEIAEWVILHCRESSVKTPERLAGVLKVRCVCMAAPENDAERAICAALETTAQAYETDVRYDVCEYAIPGVRILDRQTAGLENSENGMMLCLRVRNSVLGYLSAGWNPDKNDYAEYYMNEADCLIIGSTGARSVPNGQKVLSPDSLQLTVWTEKKFAREYGIGIDYQKNILGYSGLELSMGECVSAVK